MSTYFDRELITWGDVVIGLKAKDIIILGEMVNGRKQVMWKTGLLIIRFGYVLKELIYTVVYHSWNAHVLALAV